MQKIGTIESAMTALSANATFLGHLPAISQNIALLKDGVVAQNTALVAQQASLIQPGSRAQSAVVAIALALLTLVGVAMFIVLVRETKKDYHLSRGGIDVTEPELRGPNRK